MDVAGLAHVLRSTSDMAAAHLAFHSFAATAGASAWALAAMRRSGEGGFLFDVLASWRAEDGAASGTVGPCENDGALARTWRTRKAIELHAAEIRPPEVEGVLALLGEVVVESVAVLPVDGPDPSRRLIGLAPAGEGVDLGSIHRGFEVYVAFFARLRREANLPERTDLSRREIEILQRCAFGMKTETIAAALEVSAHTVREHLDRARIKLDARNLTHAVALAMRAGLIR
ncbi:response regulator transcription factor [Methylobacterium hispanicum]